MAKAAEVIVPFDAERAANAGHLWAVTRGQALPEGAAAIANRVGYDAAPGAVLPISGGAVVGRGNGAEPLCVGGAATSLTGGDYVAKTPMSEVDILAWGLGGYRFHKYKSGPTPPALICDNGVDTGAVTSMVDAAYLTRDLVNTPTEDMGPDELAAVAENLAAKFKAEIEIISGTALEEGFPLVHAVGRAAVTPPILIDMKWGDPSHPTITIVGKGVCFDSGGLNIKGTRGMALMKKDMGGAANALGLAYMVMSQALPVRLRVLIPAVENAIAGNAFRPGDVFKSRQGMTVEISNTDAEGRLILCDALAYAAEAKPQRIISLATLTGAARVALGPDVTPFYARNDDFATKVETAGMQWADPCWRLPLWPRYQDYLSSAIADVNHASASGFAGSITAALFLDRFVPAGIDFAHFDLYAWVPSARPGRPVGGEAMAVRAILGALKNNG